MITALPKNNDVDGKKRDRSSDNSNIDNVALPAKITALDIERENIQAKIIIYIYYCILIANIHDCYPCQKYVIDR